MVCGLLSVSINSHVRTLLHKSCTQLFYFETAIEMFRIEGKFDVPKQTIFSRIDLDRLEVWHPGTESPLLEVEVVLISFILTAHRLCCPLDVGDVIALMNALISGMVHEKRVIAWKKLTVVTTRIPH